MQLACVTLFQVVFICPTLFSRLWTMLATIFTLRFHRKWQPCMLFPAVELKYAFPSMSLEKIAVVAAITPSHSVNITLILHTVFCLILLTFAF